MSKHKHTRREFLGRVTMGCASIGVTSLFSGITNLGLMNAAAAANRPFNPPFNGYKALVCIMLQGGNDSFNMLVPRGDSEYNEYATVRGGLALSQNELLPINPTNVSGQEFGLHPSLTNLQTMFEAGNAAFISNVGALVEPTTVSDFQNQTANVPLGLFSHLDQRIHWQTSVPQNINSLGWGGRLADILYTNNANQDISMNISLDGVNIFQRGNIIKEYAISHQNTGSVLLNGSSSNNFYQTIKRQTLDNLLDQTYNNILETAYSNTISDSNGNSFSFSSAITNGTPITTEFGNDVLSQKLLMVAKTIAARDILGVSNQTFFIEFGGFDTHADLLDDHNDLMAQLDVAIASFHAAMEELGVGNDVVGFTMSDFGRKLSSNGDGADHAWGGNALVWGNAVDGQKLYGQYPELYLGNSLDIGGGRLIPTTSCDEYFAELALWFGASSSDLDQIFPNITNFWTPTPDGGPLGFMG
ncbi:MAG: DUF1501 domain-containing protein [Bacteroidetes bacterium]|nr:MAG: DUF1501 domain-containing protein [Bacteroidota bacterium]